MPSRVARRPAAASPATREGKRKLASPSPRAKKVQRKPAASQDENVVVDKLLRMIDQSSGCECIDLEQKEILSLCRRAKDVFSSQPILLELSAPIKVCGDIEGQCKDLLTIFKTHGCPSATHYLFLGNYICYSMHSIETMCLLLACKIKYPKQFFLLRGCHDTPAFSRANGFYDTCKQHGGTAIWKMFMDVFSYMPLSALVGKRIVCMNGGISPELLRVRVRFRSQLRAIRRPANIAEQGLLCDLLWSDPARPPDTDDEQDPSALEGFTPNVENDNGLSVCFGADVLNTFLKKEGLRLLIRSKQVVEDGYEFFANRKLVTIFSAASFRGEFDNEACVLSVDGKLKCSIAQIDSTEPIPIVGKF